MSLLGGGGLRQVDDNMVNRKVISKLLQRYGVKVEAVNGGPQAVKRFGEPHTFDCVLMDVQMPEMDGFMTTENIRDWERIHEKAQTPIFALTADIFAGTREKSMACGMNGFLSKPIEEDQLWKVVQQYFDMPGSPTSAARPAFCE
eukprot:jgi/Mesen1/8310/ME000455S07472